MNALHRMPALLAVILGCSLAWSTPGLAKKQPKPGRARSEYKLVVPADRIATAMGTFRLAEKSPAGLEVVFLDTKDGKLQSKGIIVRIRRREGTPGDSIVKVRIDASAAPAVADGPEAEMPTEYDWMSASASSLSRAIRHTIPPDQFNAVLLEHAPVSTLFSARQQKLLATLVPGFRWDELIEFGPIRAEVWDGQAKLTGFPKPVTVERWQIERGGTNLALLEVSVKSTTSSDTEAKELATAFFQAAADAGLGQASGQAKTKIVMDFLRGTPP